MNPRANRKRTSGRGAAADLGPCLIALLITTGCQSLGYYGQAARGHLQIVSRSRAVEKVLASLDSTAELGERLRLALRLREFAERDLALPANGHYLKYADLGRPFVVWNVYAAPEFSMEAKTWWYPFVGSLEYRGYFGEEQARQYAARLERKGYDVYLGGVQAYSTLGWFRDPLLNTFLFDPELDLADLLFHELAHQRLFISGDTDFNEAFATAVAEEGVRRWLHSGSDPAALDHYEANLRRKEQFVDLVSRARARLEILYASGGAQNDPEELRQRKRILLQDLRAEYDIVRVEWSGGANYDAWFAAPINNAKLNDVDTYYRLVPAFHALLRRHEGDLERFYGEVSTLSKLSKTDRRQRLEQGLPTSPSTNVAAD